MTLGFPLFIVYVAARYLKSPAWRRNLGERFGALPPTKVPTIPGGIWLHAVSVGEVQSAAGLARELGRRFPGRPVYVSVSTVAGRKLAEERLTGMVERVFYAPFDYPWMVRRVLRALRPSALVVLETEIWPSMWREAKRFGCTVTVVNGRISDRAWPSYRRRRWFFGPVLKGADRILAQSEGDAARYRELGAEAANNGNLKYDFAPPGEPPADVAAWVAGVAPERILIAASTLEGEEAIVVEAWRALPEGTLLIVAPRRPTRFDEVAALLGPESVRRSRLDRRSNVLLLDSIGELASLFALDYPQVVFVGGSIHTWGGHNILEPAFAGRPVLTGPHMQNFAEIDRDFRAANAVRIVRDARELAQAARELFENDGGMGERARSLAESKRGATERAVAAIELGAPRTHRPCAWLFRGLSYVWRAGMALDRRLATPKRLTKPVISVGGLSMGGAGKTPFVLRLAEVLAGRGHRVGILTRGYGGREKAPIAYPPGERAPVELTGDEAQLFLRAGHAWVGIGADRYLTGRLIEKHVDLYLLDDGFQHWALDREIDLVLLDELDPWAGGGVFPAGLLREGPEALARATRVVRPRKVAVDSPPPGRYSAFCGIANPASFWRTLRECGIEIEEWREFPDHHRYTAEDLAGLKPPIATTAKDFANLPPGAPPVHVVEIKMEIPDEGTLIELIEARLEMAGTIKA